MVRFHADVFGQYAKQMPFMHVLLKIGDQFIAPDKIRTFETAVFNLLAEPGCKINWTL